MTSTLPATLAEYTDDELALFYGGASDDAGPWRAMLEAEMQRRDAEQAAAKARRAASADYRVSGPGAAWYEAAHAQYLAAEAACAGRLLSAEGFAETSEPMTLWTGTDKWARRLASEELKNWWETHPRLTPTEYQRQASGERRNWIDRHDREAASDHVDRDAPSAVRRIASEREGSARARADSRGVTVPGSPASRGAQDSQAGRAAARSGGTVRGGRVSETTSRTEELRRRAAMARERLAAVSGDTVAGEQEPGEVIASGEPGRPATGALAVREGRTVTRHAQQVAAIAEETVKYAERVLTRHVHWPSQSALDTVTLWCFHANARDRDENGTGPLIWRASPRLLLTSKVRGSGKSTGLDLIAMLTGSRFGRLPRVTAPGFAKLMSKFQEPGILDEAKMIFGNGQKSLDLQGMLLAGYTPRSHSLTAVGGGTAEKLFGPVAYAGKDNLITMAGDGVSDLLDRSFVIRMTRPGRHYPDVDEVAERAAELACQGMGTWTSMKRGELLAACKRLERDAMLADLDDDEVEGGILRATQIWRPLLAVADVLGGDWPERGRTACEQLSMPGGEYDQWRDSLSELDGLWDDTGEDEF